MGRGTNTCINTKTFTRSRVDKLEINTIAADPNFALCEFKPAQFGQYHNPDERVCFISKADQKKLEAAGEKAVDLFISEKIEKLDLLKPESVVFFETKALDAGENSEFLYKLFEDDPKAATQDGRFDKNRLMHFKADDFSFWAPGAKTPLSRVYQIDLTSNDYQLTETQKLIDKHPWVLSTNIVEVPYYNQDVIGTHELRCNILLGQKDHDNLYRATLKTQNYFTTHSVRSHLLYTDAGKRKFKVLKRESVRI